MTQSLSSTHPAGQLAPLQCRQRPLLNSNTLVGEFLVVVVPRAVFAVATGVLIGLILVTLDLSSLGLMETTVAASFWTAAMMTATFRRHMGRMLFWVLLLDASLLIYQASIYQAVLDVSKLVRIGPAIAAAGLLLLSSRGRNLGSPSIYFIWITCNLPACVSGLGNEYMTPTDTIVVCALNMFYPLVFYYAASCATNSVDRLFDRVSFSVIVLCCAPLALIPVELITRGSSSFASLQFGGRSYAVIGAVYLLWPILVLRLTKWRTALRAVAIGSILLVFATSFSRGAMISLFLMLAGTVVFGGKARGKVVTGLAGTGLVLIGIGCVFLQEWLNEGVWFWLLRMNMASNLSNNLTFSLTDFLQSDRDSIWQLAIVLFERSPIWGYGIGSTPALLEAATSGRIAYSGMHNLFLTVLVERGLIGFAGVSLLFARIGFLAWSGPPASRLFVGYSFFVFLVFANSTGVELFLNSSKSFNVTVTVYFFILLAWLERRAAAQRTYRAGTK